MIDLPVAKQKTLNASHLDVIYSLHVYNETDINEYKYKAKEG